MTSARADVDENPYESPNVECRAPVTAQRSGNRLIRLSVFFANCFLLVLFPPTCCPCGFGPIGFVIQPYLLFLGFPAILLAFAAPATVDSHRAAFLAVYIVNYVVTSYLVGELAGRIVGRKRALRDGGNAQPPSP